MTKAAVTAAPEKQEATADSKCEKNHTNKRRKKKKRKKKKRKKKNYSVHTHLTCEN